MTGITVTVLMIALLVVQVALAIWAWRADRQLPPQDESPEPTVSRRRVFTQAPVDLHLCDPHGKVQFRMHRHDGATPETVTHAGRVFVRGMKHADGWHYREQA